MEKNFTHLHLHTEYSLLDGVGKISDYIQRAKELKMTSIGITDHGNMFGAIEMYQKAISHGIKPIIGLETYISEFPIKEKDNEEVVSEDATSPKNKKTSSKEDNKNEDNKKGRTFHLVLLAKNNTGYKNLMKISSYAYTDGFYYKPRVDKEFLKSHSEGLICLSACMQGEISRRILDNEPDSNIEEALKEYIDIFSSEDFYIEIQSNGFKEQIDLNKKLKELSIKFGLKLVATNDTHYVNRGDHSLQDIMLCIQTGSKINDVKRMRIESEELYLKSREEIIEAFGEEYIEAINNTEEIASRCNLSIEFGKFKFPHYELPENFFTPEDFLESIIYKGLNFRYPLGLSEEIIQRVEYEISVINKMGYSEYFIVVWDFIHFAKNNNIPIGPGRGSAAGSLVAYALQITDLDPLKYGLIFERFLNPERISMPDIDIDICQERRQEVIDYVTNKYGYDKVAQIITFGTLKAKAAIRDVGRVLDIPLSKIDKVAKLIPFSYSIKKTLESVPEFYKFYSTDRDIRQVIDYSSRLENKVRHSSIHAAGIVITKNSLDETVPVYKDKEGVIATQYQMKELEDLGLLKMDFLGLRNLTNLQRTIDYIKEGTQENLFLHDIPLDKKEVYELLSKGDSLGVFQLESQGIRRILTKLKPNRFQDIIALLALYRPGPLGSGMVDDFINCKNGISEIKYPHESLAPILKETYGVILYQEQVMGIANIMANYSLGEADLLRRAMGKKNFQIMNENREKFVERSLNNGYSKEIAIEIFDLIYKFAGYGFNKSHSAAYALIAYWTAYFKTYYPTYYYAALLTSEMKNIDDIGIYIEDAKKHGIVVSLPSVNKPSSKFIVKDNEITFALSAIKNVGEKVAEGIKLEWEENGDYTSLEELLLRTKDIGLNKKALESLILAGALDALPYNRKEKFDSLTKSIEYTKKLLKEDEIQQMNLFGEAKSTINSFTMSASPDFSLEERLEKEKEVLGLYFSGHPLDKYKPLLSTFPCSQISSLKSLENDTKICVFGGLRNIKKIVTKNNNSIMATFEIEDFSGRISCIAFPNEFSKYFHNFLEGNPVFIIGNINTDYFNGSETKKIICKQVISINELLLDKKLKTYVLIEEERRSNFFKLKEFLKECTGEQPLYFAIKTSTEKEIKLSPYKISRTLNFISTIIDILGEGSIKLKY